MKNNSTKPKIVATTYDNNLLITYDCYNKKFQYPNELHKCFPGDFDNRSLWIIFESDGIADKEICLEIRDIVENLTVDGGVCFKEYYLKDSTGYNWYLVGFISNYDIINVTLTKITKEKPNCNNTVHNIKVDELTGLLNKNGFCEEVEDIIINNKEAVEAGDYAIVYLDILRFKAVNDIFGTAEGDRLLIYIANSIIGLSKKVSAAGRIGSDRYILFINSKGKDLEKLIKKLIDTIKKYDLPYEITCNAGIYVLGNEEVAVDLMIDRAALALSRIKGSYTQRYNYYTDILRNEMVSEQEIAGIMNIALEERHFVVYYQPQYNHTTGSIIGAEGLVRWRHPDRGLISPGLFIPIFEKNGFITKLDLYVFEEVCKFLRKCIDKNLPLVPISTNFSRADIYSPTFVEDLEVIRNKYNVPSKYLRVEITESAIIDNTQYVNDVIKKLHSCGYLLEMDDFGSGYSSLNVLKDIDFDIIKLDMLFLAEKSDSNRGGTILSSVVRMAKWLKMPVIAEGVENVSQADFLKSVGCDYIQGYLYSRPLKEEDYEKLLSNNSIGAKVAQMDLIDTLNTYDFWNPQSQETLIFSNYVGGAAIFDFYNGKIEILRVNKKYVQELGMNLSEKEIIESDPLAVFDDFNKKIYFDAIDRAINTLEEQECETWRNISSSCCGDERMCIRSTIRMIGKSAGHYLFYAMIRNVTAEKHHYQELEAGEKRFKYASEQANIYFWEYNVATKEMRPCFRCMRDLGLPPLLRNYPDSAIEAGVFPPEIADMYRDWHVQIANGVKELEAILPLTMNRIPFRVKYTTEFDENGRPIKAYGSAALVVE